MAEQLVRGGASRVVGQGAAGRRAVGPLADLRGHGRRSRARRHGGWAASGHPIRAIAEQLGVSVSTVHNYLRARTCARLRRSGPEPARRALHRLHRVTSRRFTSPWTRDAVRDAIRAWTRGARPSAEVSRVDALALTTGRGGRRKAPAGRARPWSATSIATAPIRGTPRSRRRARPSRVPAVERRSDPLRSRRLLDSERACADGRGSPHAGVARTDREHVAATLRERRARLAGARSRPGVGRAAGQIRARRSSTSISAIRSARGTRPCSAAITPSSTCPALRRRSPRFAAPAIARVSASLAEVANWGSAERDHEFAARARSRRRRPRQGSAPPRASARRREVVAVEDRTRAARRAREAGARTRRCVGRSSAPLRGRRRPPRARPS